ncbi:MAG: hypothetical protein H6851_05235 [Geminicoccaceae bacterium]|nr:hypothetical protein [Geminicoccaceae bacterium]
MTTETLEPTTENAETATETAGNSAAAALSQPPADDPATPVLPDWAQALGDADREWLGKAGHKDIAAVVRGYRSLETFLGADKAGRGLVRPADEADAEAWGEFYKALGRPDDPAGYGLAEREGADPEFSAAAAKAMHEAGLTPAQANSLVEWFNGHGSGLAEQQTAEQARRQESEWGELQREWGTSFDRQVETARRAASSFGFSADQLGAIEDAIGTKALMQKFADIGSKLMEDTIPAGGSGGATGQFTSPAAARAEIEQLKTDPAWRNAYLNGDDPGHKAAVERFARLMQVAAKG